uniref:Uncharacterized protein n=1 Tax=Anguilla anguilla TaxID=7936 RepID=A0A0E9XXC6_ANGAN
MYSCYPYERTTCPKNTCPKTCKH